MREIQALFTPAVSETEQPEENIISPERPVEYGWPEPPMNQPLKSPSTTTDQLILSPTIPPPPEKTKNIEEPDLTSPSPIALTQAYYIQIYAFEDFNNARRQQDLWLKRDGRDVYIALAEGEKTLYKILLGPFDTGEEASSFQKEKRIRGFLRSGEGLFFLEK